MGTNEEKKNSSPFAQEGYRFMGVAFEVYNQLGGGLLEEIYQECLEIELESNQIPFRAKDGIPVYYKGRQIRKRYIPDLVVFNGLIVELKAASHLVPEHEAQLMNYLRITRQPVGYLLNFGPTDKLEWKRYILSSS
jgi:GxxExxY protein